MIAYATGLIGVWIASDGIYSIALYLNRPGYTGPTQTWRRDHSIRLVRCLLGLILVGLGAWQIA